MSPLRRLIGVAVACAATTAALLFQAVPSAFGVSTTGDFHIQCPVVTANTFDPVVNGTGGGTSHAHIFFANKGIASNSSDSTLNPTNSDLYGSTLTTCPRFTDPKTPGPES